MPLQPNGDSLTEHGRSSRVRPVGVAAVMALCIFAWLALENGRSHLSQDVEFFTAERSREMLLLGPWAVHDNFQLNAVKPPLQYWLGAFTLAHFQNREFALRIWSLLYGLLASAALGWMAAIVDRRRPWLIAVSVGLLLSCPLFLRTSYTATLDAGLIFFTTLLIVSCQLARSRPAWWALAAVACSLGALQKTPLILAIWIVILLLRMRNAEERKTLQTKWLLWTFTLAVIAVAAWPLIQIILFRLSPSEVLRYHEPLIIAQRRAGAPYLDAPYRLITFWPCGALALAATVILPLIKENRARWAATELSLLCLTMVAVCVLSNTRQVSYLSPILPSLCLVLGLTLFALLDKSGQKYRILCLLMTGIALAGLPIIAVWLNHVRDAHWRSGIRRDILDHAAIAHALAEKQGEGKGLFVIEADNDMLLEEFYLFYGGLKSPLTNVTLAQLGQTRFPPMTGISTTDDFSLLRKKYPNARIVRILHDLVCWEVE